MKNVTIRKFSNMTEKTEVKVEKPVKKCFFRHRVFIDPANKSMKYDQYKTYTENKQDYYNTLRLVFTGKCKDIFEAYSINH